MTLLSALFLDARRSDDPGVFDPRARQLGFTGVRGGVILAQVLSDYQSFRGFDLELPVPANA